MLGSKGWGGGQFYNVMDFLRRLHYLQLQEEQLQEEPVHFSL